MSGKAEYRNAIRSRNLIRKAFVELTQERDIDRISITDIVNRANINRGTFYAHYRDVRSILSQVEDEVIVKMSKRIDECGARDFVRNPAPVLLETFGCLEEDAEFFRMLMTSDVSGIFLEKIRATLVAKLMRDSTARQRNQMKFYVVVSFFAGGLVSIIKDWHSGKIDKPLSEVIGLVCDLNPYAEK